MVERMQRRDLPDGWDADIPQFPADPHGIASRDASARVLNAIAPRLPWLLGGAADLAPSTKTRLTFDGAGDFEADDRAGRNFHFGIREHAMGAVCNGLSLSKLRPFGSGFLIFSDYMKPAIRLGAIMELPVVYVFTHDSIGVGEDGPTHQPVEQLAGLRAIPGLLVLRPADANEVAEAWRVVLGAKHQPACLILSRQNLPTLDRSRYARGGRRRARRLCAGRRRRRPARGDPDRHRQRGGALRRGLREARAPKGSRRASSACRPGSCSRSRTKPTAPRCCRRTSRAGSRSSRPRPWAGNVTPDERGTIIGMKTFGASAPLKELLVYFGFTGEHVYTAAKVQLARKE